MNNKDIYKNAVNQIHADEKLKNETLKKVENNNKRGFTFARYLVACAVFVTVFAIGIIYLKDENNIPTPDQDSGQIASIEKDLLRFEDMDQLKEKIKSQKEYYEFKAFNATDGATIEDMAPTSTSSEESTNNYSRTNVQVENVDEADIVKTDGKYIYYITKNKVYIIDAKSLKNVSELSISDKQKAFYPVELFINGDKLIVIGNLYENRQIDIDYEEDEVYYNYYRTASNNGTTAIIYDLSNIEEPKIEREVMVDGLYKTSRMIDDTVYFISSKYIYYYDDMKDDELLPSFKDTAVGDKEKSIECTDIAYFEETTYSNYLMVVGFKINNKEKANIETLYGAGEDFYVSDENLYITKSNYSSLFGIDITKSQIFKFSIKDSNIKFKAETEIKGTVNNQFSMDEYDGNLRIATTSNEYDERKSKSQLLILDENLNEIGRLEDMAKGEKIYAVRFVGKVGYVVTFRQVDPLFVIDLSNPKNPQIKGELKIPGYSAYLHPYDDTHIIGIGYNTKSNGYGGVTNDTMKMSMFDVSDLENPKEMFNVDIGNSSTYSEITSNHKALFYNKEKNLIGFPINTYGSNYREDKTILALYKIDMKNEEFKEYGKIENDIGYSYNSIRRAIYVGNIIYTLSNDRILAYDIESLDKINELTLK